MPHADAFDVMVKLSEDIPPSTMHDIEELDVQKGHVIVHGIVGTIPEAQSITTSLESERCFNDVKITRTNQMSAASARSTSSSSIIKCPEDVERRRQETVGAAAGQRSAASERIGRDCALHRRFRST